MGYVYSVLWLVIAIMLFFRFRKENKAIYLLSAYFVFLSVWWFLDQFVHGLDLMDGTYVWVLRVVSTLALGVSLLVYIKEKNKTSQEKKTE